jgi:hypothetical protein
MLLQIQTNDFGKIETELQTGKVLANRVVSVSEIYVKEMINFLL